MNRVHSAASGSIPVEGGAPGVSVLESAAMALSDHFKCEWATMRNDDRDMIRGYARAVLMAVREPTRGQAEAAGVPLKQFGSWGYDPIHDRQREFTAIIDAILEDTTHDR